MLTRAQVEAAANCAKSLDCQQCAMCQVTDDFGCVQALAAALIEMMDAPPKQSVEPREGRIYRSDVDDVSDCEI